MMIINKGVPKENGVYVAYVEPLYGNIPDRKLITFVDGVWYHRGSDQKMRSSIYGWVGPLPVMYNEEVPVKELVKYAIGFPPDKFNNGPFNKFNEAFCALGDEGEYIFRLVPNKEPLAIGKWVEEKGKWVKIKK